MSDYDWTTAMRVRLEAERDALRADLATARRDLDLARARVAELEASMDLVHNALDLSEAHATLREAQVATLKAMLGRARDVLHLHCRAANITPKSPPGGLICDFLCRELSAALAATEPKGGTT